MIGIRMGMGNRKRRRPPAETGRQIKGGLPPLRGAGQPPKKTKIRGRYKTRPGFPSVNYRVNYQSPPAAPGPKSGLSL